MNIAGQHATIRQELLEAMGRVLDHGNFILGDEVQEFENRFATLCNVDYAVGVNSGTDALILAFKALGVRPGDEVISTPNAFVACTACITLVGARPVFVDVRDDYNIDPNLIERAITPRTRAIMVVHLTGRAADMAPILDIAAAYKLRVVEDCAQAVCAEYHGRRVGSLGSVGCFSFHPLKTLNACGDGGIVTTNDEEIRDTIQILRNLGLRTRDDCVAWSSNSRLDTVHAAGLLVKMKYLDKWTEKRRANSRYYQQRLRGVRGVNTPVDKPFEKAVYHTFVILAENRDGLRAYLETRGVGTAIHYPVPIHLQPAARSLGYSRGAFPVTEYHADRILSLPIYPELEESQLDYVTSCIEDFYAKKGK